MHKSQQDSIYRIIDIKNNSKNETILLAQVIGKSSLFQTTPLEILTNDDLLNGFSKKEIRMISYLASKSDNQKPSYKIFGHEICIRTNSIIYKLKNLTNKIVITKSAKELLLDKDLIKHISPEDALNVGFVAGSESVASEKTTIMTHENSTI